MLLNGKDKIEYFESVLIAFFAVSGSFYYFIPGYVSLAFIIVWMGIMLWKPIKRRERYFPIHILYILLMIIVSLRNNYYLKPLTGLPTVLLFVASVMFVFLAYYQNNAWYECSLEIMVVPYFVYSAYTIAMHFFPQLIFVSYGLFGNGDMLLQIAQNQLPGLTNHYSTNAILIANGLMIGICFAVVYWRDIKIIMYSIISMLALLWTGKRAHNVFSFIAIIVTYYVYFSDNKKKRRKHMLLAITIVSIALIIIINFVPSLALFINRFQETAEKGDLTLGRTGMWSLAIESFLEHPIIGVGWRQFVEINPMGWDAHNVFIQLLCESGIVGFTLYVLFMGYCIFVGYKMIILEKRQYVLTKNEISKKRISLYMIAFCNQIFFVTYCFTGNPLYMKECYIPYFIACAFTMTEYRKMKECNLI